MKIDLDSHVSGPPLPLFATSGPLASSAQLTLTSSSNGSEGHGQARPVGRERQLSLVVTLLRQLHTPHQPDVPNYPFDSHDNKLPPV